MSSPSAMSSTPFAGYSPVALPDGPIFVATDTSEDSDAAFPMAEVVAARTRAEVCVLSVLRPYALPLFAMDAVAVSSEAASDLHAAREAALRSQMARLVPSSPTWPVIIVTGEPTQEIVAQAAAVHARVIVTGRGRHSVLERVMGGESVLRMLQLGDVPVLAVEPGMTRLPRRVVIATDFSDYSLYAARVALSLVAPDSMVWLVNVAPPFESTDVALHKHAVAYREQSERAFASLRGLLERGDLQFENVMLEGNASDQLVSFATSSDADLVVLSTHGYGFLRRMILGSVAATIVRGAPCSVLCVPGSARSVRSVHAPTG